jgi:hypothetical protein
MQDPGLTACWITFQGLRRRGAHQKTAIAGANDVTDSPKAVTPGVRLAALIRACEKQ